MTFSKPNAPVFYSETGYRELKIFLKENNPSGIYILVDSNSHNFCLSRFLQNLKTSLPIEILEMEAGEENKTITTCSGLWEALSDLGADRKSLLINLGGGVVTDLGGFIASTFKRGISFINIPTTLLAMVDASVGGKTGVDLGALKNQVGVINQPEMVVIDTSFLETLQANEMRSGLAEILKHGLIADETYWNKAINLQDLNLDDLEGIIKSSVKIKSKIVEKDPTEKGPRKVLNFGHTFGHAIESYYLGNQHKTNLLHGEAVAAGMILACYISTRIEDFPEAELDKIKNKILEFFPKLDLKEIDFEPVWELLKFDKKNSHGTINFVLLKAIGKPVTDCRVDETILKQAWEYYLNL